MILTRCPECGTLFRVHPEQLKARGGLVRCGRCQAPFDALAHLLDDVVAPPVAAAVTASPAPAQVIASPAAYGEPAFVLEPSPPGDPVVEPAEEFGDQRRDESSDIGPADEPPFADAPDDDATPSDEIDFDAADTREPFIGELPTEAGASAAQPTVQPATLAPPEDARSGTEAARAAGLVAPRDTTEITGYSTWHQGTLAGGPPRRPRWPFVIAAVLLALTLAGQVAFAFRTAIATALPALAPAYAALGIAIPLPRQPDLISLDASELQTDAAHGGLLALQATIKNRAGFAQDYPNLELTLTDTQDNAVARRVFAPGDYLPSGTTATAGIAARGELAVRLWIDASGVVAAGYRLYVYYP